MNDRAFYEALLAPHFLLMEPFRFPPQTKQAYLDAEFPAGRAPRRKSTMSDFRAFVDGDTAVVTYQVVERYPLGGGQPLAATTVGGWLDVETSSRRLDTYARMEGVWRLLSMAVAEPPSWPDVAAIDPQIYAEYAGTYELTPDTRIVVTNESGHLMAQMTGQAKTELFPENATTFFDRTDSPLARTVFERDGSGKVVAQIYRGQGHRLRAKKVQGGRPARAAVLVTLEPPLRALLERYHPGIRFETIDEGLTFEHDTRTFQVPEYLKAGEPRKLVETRGPSPCAPDRKGHGILGSVRVVPGAYAGQRAVPPGVSFQGSRSTYFDSLWGLVPSPDGTAHLNVTLSYPACVDSAFLKQFQALVQDAWRDVK